MINPYKMRRWGALILVMFFAGVPGIMFLQLYHNYWIAIGAFMGGGLVSVIIASFLLSNPFQVMLEGSGMLVINIDSTGVIRPFIVRMQSPFIHGNVAGHDITDIFDRQGVYQLTAPHINTAPAVETENSISIKLDKDGYNKGRFVFNYWPTLIWNDQIHSLVTKDFLAEQEKMVLAEHGILYLNRRIEVLTAELKYFARYVIENLKPGGSFFANKWVWIILIAGVALVAIMFGPSIITAIKGAAGGGGNILPGAVGPGKTIVGGG